MDQVIKMMSKKQIIGISLIMLTTAITRASAQTNEIENLLHDFRSEGRSRNTGHPAGSRTRTRTIPR